MVSEYKKQFESGRPLSPDGIDRQAMYKSELSRWVLNKFLEYMEYYYIVSEFRNLIAAKTCKTTKVLRFVGD